MAIKIKPPADLGAIMAELFPPDIQPGEFTVAILRQHSRESGRNDTEDSIRNKLKREEHGGRLTSRIGKINGRLARIYRRA